MALRILTAALFGAAVFLNVFATDNGRAWAQAALPDRTAQTILIRTTIVALNHANVTGNYAVLRDLGSPAFILSNSPASLAASFAALRQSKLDIGPVVMFDPIMPKPAQIDSNGMLRLSGYFPTNPLRVKFELAYTQHDGGWRLAAIAVVAAPPNE
ncbi:MAG: hypothetical protein ACPG06_03745 [Alphaproteobacteria bacterium]